MSFIHEITNTTGFMPHGNCFVWQTMLLTLYVISDLTIVLAYYSIPFALFYFVKKRVDLEYRWVMVLFAIFIFLCGTTHLIDVILIWIPYYWLAAGVKLLTAIVSFITAVLIWFLLPKLLALPSPKQLLVANQKLHSIIEKQQSTEEELQKFSLAVAQSASMIVITDNAGIIEYCNPVFCEVTGYEKSEVIGKKTSLLKSGLTDEKIYSELWNTISAGLSWQGEFLDRKKNGDIYWCCQSISPVKNKQGEISHFIAITQDISERKNNEKTIQHLAFYDPLTDLPNRMLFRDRLERAKSHAKLTNSIFALLYLDLDRFKNINDSLGHVVGDKLLIAIGERLKSCLREQDTIARLGGDEFAMIVCQLSRVEAASELANRLITVISQPISIDGHELFITTSIGISTFPNDTCDVDELIRKADKALYQAKDAGRNNYEFFNEAINALSLRRLKIEKELRSALKNNEFTVYYQPKIDLNSKKIVGVEALLRWTHPVLGAISPVEFIPIAEENGLIIEISEWVLKIACDDLNDWQKKIAFQVPVAINLSARQFREIDLLNHINAIRERAGISAHLLEFEITESMIMNNPEYVITVLEEFKRCGFKLSIDDFGTGYSSLNYLKRFPVDHLKIDYSFVRDIVLDRNDACIVTAIIALAHSLNLKVIAEGVSSLEQLEFLKQHHCEVVQGFYFSPPIHSAALLVFMQENIATYRL